MAIVHFSVKSVSRKTGRTAVAASAYRSGERLVDYRTGEIHDYRKRSGVLYTRLFLPDGLQMTREDLWNAAEAVERRKDSKVSREFIVAIPHELKEDEQQALITMFADGLSERNGWAVDMAIHAPGRGGDIRNVHAHLLCTTRKIVLGELGLPVLGPKTREWDCLMSARPLVMRERTEWGRCMNEALETAGLDVRVDTRSYAAQGVDRIPQIHLGVHANAMERRGLKTEVGELNREIKTANKKLAELERQLENSPSTDKKAAFQKKQVAKKHATVKKAQMAKDVESGMKATQAVEKQIKKQTEMPSAKTAKPKKLKPKPKK